MSTQHTLATLNSVTLTQDLVSRRQTGAIQIALPENWQETASRDGIQLAKDRLAPPQDRSGNQPDIRATVEALRDEQGRLEKELAVETSARLQRLAVLSSAVSFLKSPPR
jgi:hypothetical protein